MQLCLCVRCTKIINADSEDPKYIINVKQFAKFVVDLSDQVAPTDIEEGMRVGYAKSSVLVSLPADWSFLWVISHCSLTGQRAFIANFCSGWNDTTTFFLLDDSNSPACSAGILFWCYFDKNWQNPCVIGQKLFSSGPSSPSFQGASVGSFFGTLRSHSKQPGNVHWGCKTCHFKSQYFPTLLCGMFWNFFFKILWN